MVGNDVIISSVVGAVVGIIVSFFFVKYSAVDSYKATIFGMNSNSFITGITFFIIVCGVAIFSAMAGIIRDVEFIIKEPLKFTLELLAMGLLPTIALLLVMYFRTNKITSKNKTDSLIIFLKFALFHVLFQISGYYRYVFE